MILIQCRTNLDLHPQEQWPTELPESPMVGDNMFSEWSGVALKVVGRSWIKRDSEYILEIELHDRCTRTIAEFQEYYSRLLDHKYAHLL